MLHCPMRMHEMVLTLLYTEVLNGKTKKEVNVVGRRSKQYIAPSWKQAKDDEFERVLMSESVQTYCYQDDSYVDPNRTKRVYTQMDNGLQISLTNSNITAPRPYSGTMQMTSAIRNNQLPQSIMTVLQ